MDDYRDDRICVWIALLIDEWEEGSRKLIRYGYPRMRRPNFAINPHIGSRFGSWDADRRMIEISESLFLEYERDAVVEVLRHEMAHQVISETQGGRDESDHGPRWRQACKALGCDASASTCDGALRRFTASPRSALLDRINKLLTHGRCDSATRAESEAFLAKAQELMMRHQVEMTDIDRAAPQRQIYVQRPIGKLFKRLPGYYHVLGNLLGDHYYVNYVQTHTRVYLGDRREWRTRIELFGTRENVDVADYVASQLLTQAEAIWQNERRKLRRPQRKSFFIGLFDGFAGKLAAQKQAGEAAMSDTSRQLILREHAHRQKRYFDAYPNLRGGRITYYAGDSHDAGRRAGADIHIKPGVKTGGRETRQLT